MPLERSDLSIVVRTGVVPAGGAHSRQRALFCACGREAPWVAGLCRACYRAEAHSRQRFAGLRDEILRRDGYACRGCGASHPRLHVHHRKPGVHERALLVTLCAACHARLHRLGALRIWIPEPLVVLWAEQHPGVPLQLQMVEMA
jgi:NMD protein affecting ribosome stability and mRNA decay